MPSRPISPHLSVYKFKYTLLSSILNRFTGMALSLGLVALSYWLLAVADGARAQAQAEHRLPENEREDERCDDDKDRHAHEAGMVATARERFLPDHAHTRAQRESDRVATIAP